MNLPEFIKLVNLVLNERHKPMSDENEERAIIPLCYYQGNTVAECVDIVLAARTARKGN
jgi:hypothetical protein